MNKLLIAGVTLTALIAAPANAADLSAAPVYKAASPALYSWTGCYLGANAGGGIMNDSYTARNGGGGIAGGQLGCNYQVGKIVVGVEGEGAWSDVSNKNHLGLGAFVSDTTSTNRWDADVAIRLGSAAVDRVLIYSKLGVAWGRYDYAMTTNAPLSQSGSGTFPGLLLGAGFEFAFPDSHWTGKIEYNYINYLGENVTLNCVVGCTTFVNTESAAMHVVKAGLNYKWY